MPGEYLGEPEVSALYEQYASLIDRFKAVHKEREIGRKVKDQDHLYTSDNCTSVCSTSNAFYLRLEFRKCQRAHCRFENDGEGERSKGILFHRFLFVFFSFLFAS